MNKIILRENLSKRVERIDDGEILNLNDNGTYSFINSCMHKPYEYSLERLMEDPRARGKFKIKEDSE